MKFGSITPVFNEEDLIGPFLDLMDVTAQVIIISDLTFKGNRLPHDRSEQIALDRGAVVIRCNDPDQIFMRNLGLALLHGLGIDYAFINDVDEWYPKETLTNYKKFIEENLAEGYKAKMQVMFRNPNWGVVSPTDSGSLMALKTSNRLKMIRRYEDADVKTFPEELGRVYHLSYARTPEKIKEKIVNFSHAHEVIPTWFEDVFLPCTVNSRNVHPTTPEAWPELFELNLPDEIKVKIPKKLWTQ